ncbi:fam-l protein [Plasmodium malariae]|uniref:Fam-l protein n=1 Tax=Plasmodium malariae TaxID=5858 RepID=A0A1D3TDS5_PLAMA|nr:fam-l protein [Plasmodium malariae]SCP03096.1 fam-l protein [Plasmodium malariae]
MLNNYIIREQIKSLLFINVAGFMLLGCIYPFCSDSSIFNKSLDENFHFRKTLKGRTYRLLTKHKQDEDSDIANIKEVMAYNKVNEKKNRCNNNEELTGKNKIYDVRLLNNSRGDNKDKQSKSCIYETKEYSHLEKKIFKNLDYIDFIKNNKTISDKFYKKIIRKKYGLRLVLPLILFLLLSFCLILNFSLDMALKKGLLNVFSSWSSFTNLKSTLDTIGEGTLGFFWKAIFGTGVNSLSTLYVIIIYFLPIFILGVIFLMATFYYHKKVKKYEKIKFRKR